MKIQPLIRLLFIILIMIPIITAIFFIIGMGKKIYCSVQFTQLATPAKIAPYPWRRTGLVTLWFDNAYASQGSPEVMALMAKYQFVGAISVPTYQICSGKFLTWDQLRLLQEKGWETASRGVSRHCQEAPYNAKAILNELVHSKEMMQKRGLRANHFVAICNTENQEDLWGLARLYYLSYRINVAGVNLLPVKKPYQLLSVKVSAHTSFFEIKDWLDEAKAKKGWLILVFHQFDDSGEGLNVTTAQFAEILQLVKQSGLPVVLPSQVLSIRYKKLQGGK